MGEEKRSPSEVLRRMLDERGVEYEAFRDVKNRCVTKWRTYHGAFVFFAVEKEGKLFVETASDTSHSAICTPEQAIAATMGDEKGSDGRVSMARQMRTVLESRRTCATCPEMDNPDSYIRHLQSALKWHDEHVPRPTNQNATCVVLQGERPPEEVLFVREDGGVTHYLPEGAGTCKRR